MDKLTNLLPKIALKPYTEEQLTRARQIVSARNALCSPDCPTCGGLGYVQVSEGKIQPCPNVDPLKLYPGERYGISDRERGATWADVDDIENALEAAAMVRETLEAGYGWVYLWGNYGVGKTLTLKIAVAESLRNRRPAAYCRMVEILDNLKAAFDTANPSEESQKRLDWFAELPVLCIDEIDRINGTPYATERRFLLMDRRYEDAVREKTVTLLASNTDPAKLEGYLADRIQDGRFKVIKILGDSYRPGAE